MTNVLLTGASRGIGLNLVRVLLKNPSRKVFATCRDPTNAKQLDELRSQYPDRLFVEALTVNDESSIKALVDSLQQKKVTLQVLINNAGVYSGMEKETLLNSTKESMMSVYETNCVAPMLLIQNLYNNKLFAEHALVVNISSIMGSITETTFAKRGVSYCCSKVCILFFIE